MTDHTKVVYAQVDKKKLKLVDRNETPPRESSIGCLLQHSVWTNAVFVFTFYSLSFTINGFCVIRVYTGIKLYCERLLRNVS